MKKLIILLIVAGVIAFLWWSFKPEIVIEPAGSESASSVDDQASEVIAFAGEVIYENSVFNPSELRLKVGDRVVFTNKHAAAIRISSNPHPIHTSFREFDSDTLQPGETYEFTFKTPIVLSYHNHFNPGVGGKIIVE